MGSGWAVFLCFFVLLGVVPFVEWLIFEIYTKRLERIATTGDRAAVIRILEAILRLPALYGKAPARLRLAHQYQVNKQYEQAEEQYRKLLRLPLPSATEALIHGQLAECLEAQGKTVEAGDERRRSDAMAEHALSDPTAALAKAQLLERESRYAEACDVYENALPYIDPRNNALRSNFLARLATASFNAGRSEDAVAWGEAALRSGPTGVILDATRSMTALAYRNLGDLDRSEALLNLAYEQASSDARTEQAAGHLANISMIQFARGALADALATADQSIARGTKYRSVAYIAKYEVFKFAGRYDEAFGTLDASADPPALAFKVSYVTRHNAINLLARAHLYVELREPEKAMVYFREGAAGFANHVKMTLFCDAMLAWITALLGDRESAAARIARVEGREENAGTSRTTLIDVLVFLSRAACEIGDYETAERLVRRLFTLKPYPVQLPQFHLLLGESLRGLGDDAGARREFESATAFKFGTIHESEAQARLSEPCV